MSVSKNSGRSMPTIASACRATRLDEMKRKERGKGKETDKLKMTRSAHVSSTGDNERAKIGINTNLLERSGDTYSGFYAPRSSCAIPCSYLYTPATQEHDLRDNLDFYQGKIKSKPVPGHFIKDMLKWKGDYETLEWNHQYIQWLFPIPEGCGLNRYAQPLTRYEAEEIKRDDKASKRVLGAYKMMLDFYGMRLADENVGTVTRSETNWEERYAHLNRSRDNLLRITRIIKSVGELGFERFQFQWVNFLFEECVVNKALPNLNKSCFYHWIDAIHDGAEKEIVYRKMHGLPIKIEITLQDTNSESDEEEDIAASQTRDILEKGATGTNYTTKEVPSKIEQKTTSSVDTVPAPLSKNDQKRLRAHKDFSDKEVPKDGEHAEKRYSDLGYKDDAEDDDIQRASARKKSEYTPATHEPDLRDNLDFYQGKIKSKPVPDRSASLLEKSGDPHSGFDAPRSSYARTFSYQYTHATQEPDLRDNLDFYQGKIKSKPVPGHSIKDMLKWKGDYDTLEWNHQYIQWLFPIPEGRGLNLYAQPLTRYEAEEIKRDDKASKRVLGAYKMMLDFYGMRLADENVGTVTRSETNWEERYAHLNRSRDNLLRITRIIKSVGELGFERFQFQWVNFLFEECVVNKALPNLNKSCFYHWIDAIHDGAEKEIVYRKMHGLPIKIERTLQDTNSESDEEEDIAASQTRDILEKGATGTNYTTKEVPSKIEQKTTSSVDTVPAPLSKNDRKRLRAHKDFSDKEVPKDGEHAEKRYSDLGYKDDAEDDDIQRASARKKSEYTPATHEPDLRDNLDFYQGKIKSKPVPDRSASLLEKSGDPHSGFDAPRSSYARTFSYQYTPATHEPYLRDNLDFYQGKIKSKPVPGHYIKDMLKWKGDYDMLDRNHQYIQWLFPIPEGRGLNLYAQQLTQYEAEEIKLDDRASKRVLGAYKMMLDFYGMRLADENVGTVKRSATNWKERYAHLNRSRHTLLRITRIIKSVGELGFERFQFQWVNFLFEECVVNKALPNLNKSCFYRWIDVIHDGAEKEIVYRKMHGLPIKIERTLQDTNSESDEEEDIAASKTRDILEKGATGTSYTTKEVPSKIEQKLTTSDGSVPELLSENDRKRLSAHKDFSDREGQKDGENVEKRYTDLGDKDDAEYDDILGASARNKSEAIIEGETTSERVHRAYVLILDYYGMEIVDRKTGELKRSTKWESRREKLNASDFNLRSITGILKSLGNIGYERYQVPFVKFLTAEVYNECMIHWIDAIKDDGERCQMHMNYRNLIEEKYVIVQQNDENNSNGGSLRSGNGTEKSTIENSVLSNSTTYANDAACNYDLRSHKLSKIDMARKMSYSSSSRRRFSMH